MSSERRKVPAIKVTSIEGAPQYLLAEPGVACLVSIGEPGDPPPEGFARPARRLRLEFADIIDDSFGGVVPAREDIEKLIAFAADVCASEGSTLIQCKMGISRSTAAAFIIFAVALGPGEEEAALEAAVAAAAPGAHPNRRMVQLADELLARNGAMVSALDAFYQRQPNPSVPTILK